MSHPKLALLLLVCAATLALSEVHAADEVEILRAEDVQHPARTSLRSFEWLVGQWRGEGLGGEIEEVWIGPVGNAMQGMFRLVRDGEVVLYELMTLVDEDGRVTLHVKHFGPDLKAQEAADETAQFDLLRFDTGHFQFDGLTWTHDANRLVMHIVVRNRAGEERTERIELERRSRLVLFE
ncbi:MAG TPA: DUF6265 family protein [Steroidobacteraceae bacterium]|nr:DUF6265 family protein [Steroidobacteraceae bacterium]